MGDGYLNKCIACTKTDVAVRSARRAATPEGLESERARGRDKYARLYAVGPNWQSPLADPEVKRHANNALGNAVRDGRMVKPECCEDCGREDPRLHGHHVDYNAPLEVVWVCSTCHRRRHALFPERVKASA